MWFRSQWKSSKIVCSWHCRAWNRAFPLHWPTSIWMVSADFGAFENRIIDLIFMKKKIWYRDPCIITCPFCLMVVSNINQREQHGIHIANENAKKKKQIRYINRAMEMYKSSTDRNLRRAESHAYGSAVATNDSHFVYIKNLLMRAQTPKGKNTRKKKKRNGFHVALGFTLNIFKLLFFVSCFTCLSLSVFQDL